MSGEFWGDEIFAPKPFILYSFLIVDWNDKICNNLNILTRWYSGGWIKIYEKR